MLIIKTPTAGASEYTILHVTVSGLVSGTAIDPHPTKDNPYWTPVFPDIEVTVDNIEFFPGTFTLSAYSAVSQYEYIPVGTFTAEVRFSRVAENVPIRVTATSRFAPGWKETEEIFVNVRQFLIQPQPRS